MIKAIVTGSIALIACCLSYGQTVDKTLTFEAASVKPASLPAPDGQGRILLAGPTGGPGTKDPGRIRYPYITLRNLLMNAYDVKGFQLQGPSFLDTERFEINATMPPETTREQFRVMLQNLLAERFKLKVHREAKELPIYSLGVARNGPKLKEAAPAPNTGADPGPPPPLPPPGQVRMDPDGFPMLPLPAGGGAGLFMMMMPGRARLIGRQQSMVDLANRLTAQLNRPVVDATGLTAKYDFTVTFSPEGLGAPMGPMGAVGVMAPAPPPAGPGVAGEAPARQPESEALPNLFTALKEQLGLTLEPKKGPVELIVIDHIEKTPTEN